MRSGAAAVHNTLTPPAQTVLRHAISNARGRGHAQVQPLHVALVLLAHGGPLLRQACADLHTQTLHGLQQCRALELCFNVALDRLPQSSSSNSTHPLGLSNALVAALKRAQAHQKRGCPEQQQPPLLTVKVEIEQLIISILEDPSVSRVMKEAGFLSQQVKSNLENAISLSGLQQQSNFIHKPFASAGSFGIQPITTLENPQFPTQDGEIKQIIEVMLSLTKKNPIIVSDSLGSADATFTQLQTLIITGKVPQPLQNIQVINSELSSRVFSQQEMEQKLSDLNKFVDECMPRGCILHMGNLQWLVNPDLTNSMYCAAQHAKIEIGRMLDRHRNNRVWFTGVASLQSWQSLQKCVDSKWGLQHVLVSSPANFDFNSRSLDGIAPVTNFRLPPADCMGAKPPMLPLAWIMPDSTGEQKLECCPECMSHLNAECKQLKSQESSQASSDRSPSNVEAEAVVPPLPSWLQKEKDITSEQEKCNSFLQKLQELQRKWQHVCRTSHLEKHLHSVPSSIGDGALDLLPHSWMNGNIPNNAATPGLMVANSAPLQSMDTTLLSTAKPSQTLNLPHWARGLSPIATPEDPRSSDCGTIGSNMQGLENLEEPATLVVDDTHDKMEDLRHGRFRSIQHGRPQLNPSPLSKLHASLPRPSAGGCPLRGHVLSGEKPFSTLKTPKAFSKSPLVVNSPLRLAQKHSLKSSLNRSLDMPLKNDKPPIFFDQKAAERLKHVHRGLMEKVSWQSQAVSQISTTLVNAHSGMGKLRGLVAKADTWLLLLGPDQVGKRLVADALAELVIGIGSKPICFGLIQEDKGLAFSRWGRKDQEIDGLQYRGRTTLDSVADALRTNPLCVLMLEDIDQADSVLRMNLTKAMETGKFIDSSDRHVSVGNAIIIMTSKLGTNSISRISKDNPLCEEKLAHLNGARMTLVLEPPKEKEVILQGVHKIGVVKDVSFAPVVDNPLNPVVDNPLNPIVKGMLLKRKSSGFLSRSLKMHSEKRAKVVATTGRTVPLDLNLSAEENEAVLTDPGARQEEDAINCRDSTGFGSNACDSDPILSAVQEALSPSFCSLVDNAVVFEPFDMMGLANRVLSKLSNACSELITKFCSRVEVDFQLLEHMVAIIWRTPGGNEAFDTWVQEKLKPNLSAFTAHSSVLSDRVLKFVYEDSFSKRLCLGSELPLHIEVGSR